MKAKDLMTTTVVTVGPTTSVTEIANTLLTSRISAVPVVDDGGTLVGIVSEGDLLNRLESETRHEQSFWKRLWAGPSQKSTDFRHVYGRNAGHLMTSPVVTVTEQASLADVAALLEKHRIKRVPVVRDGEIIGLLSRADLLRPLLEATPVSDTQLTDSQLIEHIEKRLREAGIGTSLLRVFLVGDAVHVSGFVGTERELTDARIAVDSIVQGNRQTEIQLTVRATLPESV